VTARVSVVVCAYTQERWPDVVAAMASIRAQTVPADDIVLAVDHNPALLERAREALPDVRCVPNAGQRGLSGARNSGVAAAAGDVIAFLDDDAVAETDWLACLLRGYADPRVLAVGGAVLPRWAAGRPPAFPPEFDWVVGCTYRGMPEAPGPVRNIIGANMSFRRDVLEAVGGFRDGIGRVGTVPVGCEETELCLRARRRFPEGIVLYEPRAAVRHRVPAERASWRYFAARCYAEGRSKALVTQLAGPRAGLASERAHVAGPLRRAIARDVAAAARTGDPIGVARAGAVAVGVALASAGFAAGAAGTALPRRTRPRPSGEWQHFAIHDRVGIRLAADAPGAPQLKEMLEPFLVEHCDREDLTISGRLEPLDALAESDGCRYGEDALELPARRLQVKLEGGSMRLNGEGELLVPTLALLDHAMTGRDAAMIHSAAIARDGRGVCIAGAGGAGKTSAALELARRRGDGFMADDWCFLAADGRLLGYAKPLFLRPHHRALLPGGTAARRTPLAPSALARPLGLVADAVHPFASRNPRAARVARRWWPEHAIVPAREVLGDATIVPAAALHAVVFVERAACAEPELEPRDADWMAARLVGSFHAELPRGARDLVTALAGSGLLSLEQAFADKAAVLRRALADRPTLLLRVPREMRAREAAQAIANAIDLTLETPGRS
jgi:GT2 family glycosyltransferase